MSNLTDKILKGVDEGLLTGIIIVDLQKAFDTINHEVLLQKLNTIRKKFSENSFLWLKSNLCDRIFLVETGNKLSGSGEISIGFHPKNLLLFLIYAINLTQ